MQASELDLPLLRRLHPVGTLAGDRLKDILPITRKTTFRRGEPISRPQDWSGQVVYLAQGELRVDTAAGGKEVWVGGHGQALNPLIRDTRVPRAMVPITDVSLISFAEDPLDVLVTWDQLAVSGADPADADTSAPDWRSMSGVFSTKSLTEGVFSCLPPANIGQLLKRFERIAVKKGDMVIRQGAPGDYYYVIERGRCRVTRDVAGSRLELAELRDGDAFGEEALVADASRNATVEMITSGVLLRLAKGDFVTMLKEPLLHRLDAAAAAARASGGAVWIDVRFPAEFREDGIPGAINIPLNELRTAAAGLDPKTEYIVYCQTGRRSSAGAFLMSQRGLNVFLLDGGCRQLRRATEHTS